MKKVLIIAYHFPPSNVIGAQRPYKLAKYFPLFGWEPIILTPKLSGKPPDGVKVIETNYLDMTTLIKSKFGFETNKSMHEQFNIKISKNFKYSGWKSKMILLFRQLINYPDDKRGWYKFALESAHKLFSETKIDAIISTSGPVTCHLIARKLKLKYNVQWIADLRDLWSQRPYRKKYRVISFIEKRLELRTLSKASALVTVTKPWITTLESFHRNKKVYCITNGYDAEDFLSSTTKLTGKFTITYTGILYNGKRDPSTLFEVVAQLIKDGKINKDLIEIRFYGPSEDWLFEDIKKYNLENIACIYGQIQREEALIKQKESQLLLLLMWNNKKEEGFCPGKIYEYFGAQRPIIAIGWPGSVVKEMLEITNAGRFAINTENLKNIVFDYYREFVDFGEVKCRSNNNVNAYKYDAIAKKYSNILNEVINEN